MLHFSMRFFCFLVSFFSFTFIFHEPAFAQSDEYDKARQSVQRSARQNVRDRVNDAERNYGVDIFDRTQVIPGVPMDAPRSAMRTFAEDMRSLAEGRPTWLDRTDGVSDNIRQLRPEYHASTAAQRAWDSLTDAQRQALRENPNRLYNDLQDASAEEWNEMAEERDSDSVWERPEPEPEETTEIPVPVPPPSDSDPDPEGPTCVNPRNLYTVAQNNSARIQSMTYCEYTIGAYDRTLKVAMDWEEAAANATTHSWAQEYRRNAMRTLSGLRVHEQRIQEACNMRVCPLR